MYLLEGNIGVGKSTFLKLVQAECRDIMVIQEPQESWTSQTYGQSLLENFYKDPQRWAYTIETLALVTRIKHHMSTQALKVSLCLMERSVYSGHYCFAQNGYANGFLSPLEWDVYSRMVDVLVHQHCKPPHGFIYLRATPEICFDRIKRRHRQGEDHMSFEYLTHIGEWHEKFLIEKKGIAHNLVTIPVLVLDAQFDLAANPERFKDYVQKVREFITRTEQDRVSSSINRDHGTRMEAVHKVSSF
ncbi:MAG: deoxynucleoside kinase [Candidatus Babeliales bacterium]|jgi:deoxyadenosine/deoxycytidine kinase